MFDRTDWAKSFHAARRIQEGADKILQKARPYAGAPDEQVMNNVHGKPLPPAVVEIDTLFLHAASTPWSVNVNRNRTKFYIIDGDGREIGVMLSETDAQLLCQAVNEHRDLSLAEQARSDAVVVIHQHEATIKRLRQEIADLKVSGI